VARRFLIYLLIISKTPGRPSDEFGDIFVHNVNLLNQTALKTQDASNNGSFGLLRRRRMRDRGVTQFGSRMFSSRGFNVRRWLILQR